MITLKDRFETKYQPVPEAGCWVWTGKLNDKGYGRLSRGARSAGWHYAHRVSYQLHVGDIPKGMHVLHRCDVPCCVNPAHLFLGTQADNNADRDSKGRHVALRGARNGMAKLTTELVSAIRSSTLSSIALAMTIPIDASTIRKVRRGVLWGCA